MQQADDVSSYAWEEFPRIHGVQSLMNYSNTVDPHSLPLLYVAKSYLSRSRCAIVLGIAMYNQLFCLVSEILWEYSETSVTWL